MELLTKNYFEKGNFVSWATFHALLEPDPVVPPAISVLLALFYEKAATIALVKHGMEIQKNITDYLNPGQTLVTCQFFQWKYPEPLGETAYVVMFGGLHIEITLWKKIGRFLDGFDWTTALCEAGIATSVIPDSFLKDSLLTRTRHSHQVTALSLTKLQKDTWQVMVPKGETLLNLGERR